MEDTLTIAPGAQASATARLFAGAKEVAILDRYQEALGLNRFDLAIDWGWFRFITKPMFALIDAIFRLVGNFGVAILIVTLMLKVAFFPLANKSYASTAKMKALQPQIQLIRERFADDRMKQQQATMELYRKEKLNPLAGCLPTLVQSRSSSRCTRCCSSRSRCVRRISSAGSRICPRRIRPACSIFSG